MSELTKEQAIAFSESKVWMAMTDEERFLFQMVQPLLCMPFGAFHEATEKALKRPVFTHEFVNQKELLQEFYGTKEPPSMEDIINMIPEEKRIIIETPETGEAPYVF